MWNHWLSKYKHNKINVHFKRDINSINIHPNCPNPNGVTSSHVNRALLLSNNTIQFSFTWIP